MARILIAGAVAMLVVGCSTASPKTEPASESPGQVVQATASKPAKDGVGRTIVEFVEVSATVKAVNLKKRTVTLVGPDRKTRTVDVDPAVKRLSEVKPGDKVVVQYFESLAFELREPTAEERKSPKVAAGAVGKNTADLPPGAAAARSLHAIVTIQAIDRNRKTVTVKGPEGRVVEVQVIEPKNLEKIKIGDTVAVTYTEGLAIGIKPES